MDTGTGQPAFATVTVGLPTRRWLVFVPLTGATGGPGYLKGTYPKRQVGAAVANSVSGAADPGKIGEREMAQFLLLVIDEWDEIPDRLTAGGHVVRVGWFTTIPRHTVSVTAAARN